MEVATDPKKYRTFNEKQKEIKQEIIDSLFELMSEKMTLHKHEFDGQMLADLILNCLITFCSINLIDFFINSTGMSIRKKIMDEFFSVIRQEVENGIKNQI